MASAAFQQWRSPPPANTPALEPSDLPGILSPKAGSQSIGIAGRNGHAASGADAHNNLSFLPPCEHGKDGDMHAHAFDLLSLAGSVAEEPVVPSSVPAKSVLSATRPANATGSTSTNTNGNSSTGSGPKARRMSSSTTGVLGRGKLGLMGDSLGLSTSKDARPSLSTHASSFTSAAPIPARRPGMGLSPTPQLFDFAKTDRRPSQPQRTPNGSVGIPVATGGLAASMPAFNGASHIHRAMRKPSAAAIPTGDDMELDMEFDGGYEEEEEEDDDGASGERSGSAELELDPDDDGEIKPSTDWDKLALGKGSGGVKGRRKGMVFKCENCKKEYRHPSCLVKHRWEHSPHWREPTQISMSKHQQVQMLEAAAILAHLDPTGRSLPTDKSLWPAILSPGEMRRLGAAGAIDPSMAGSMDMLRSPPSSTIAPLTPGSLHNEIAPSLVSSSSSLLNQKPRKSSPGSDSTSSEGPVLAAAAVSPLGIVDAGRRGSSSIASSFPQPGTPQSIGSLPDMAGLHFHSGSIPNGQSNGGFSSGAGPAGLGASPIPNRGGPGRASLSGTGGATASSLSLSLTTRAAMIGGGMFGAVSTNGVKIQTEVPRSSVRSGADDEDEDEDELDGGRRRGGDEMSYAPAVGNNPYAHGGKSGLNLHPYNTVMANAGAGAVRGVGQVQGAGKNQGGKRRGKSSSEERDDDWGDAMDMEL